MKQHIALGLAFLIAFNSGFAQNTESNSQETPYKVALVKDGAIIAGSIGLNVLGYSLIKNKKDLTAAELASKTRDQVPFFDRGNAGYYSEKADNDSYIPFQASFAMPVILAFINPNERHHLGQVLVLYTETMAITGAVFTMATGNVYRSRPYVYGTKAPYDLRLDKNSQRAFFRRPYCSYSGSHLFYG